VRELLDNAMDAGAGNIDVYIENGGLTRVRVVDDGAGMEAADLELCFRPHATSKIETEDDLLTVTSLGFRGEALSSIAIAARLEVVSARAPGPTPETAHRLIVRGGKLLDFDACQGRPGTTADVSELFFDFPARKKFLRSASAESALCRTVFNDRATAFPEVGFRFFTDGVLKLFLPPAGPTERIAAVHGQGIDARLLFTGKSGSAGFSVSVAAGDPSLRRRDRKLIQIFVNNRRVPEFSLMQAVEYGYSGFMPGGYWPVAFVFVEIDPSLADFNIHPAKKEVRLRNLPDVHAAVVGAVREALSPHVHGRQGADGGRNMHPGAARVNGQTVGVVGAGSADGQSFFESLVQGAPDTPLGDERTHVSANFLGQVFGVFLVFEFEGKLILLDQHAAHERLIFERLSSKAPRIQEMLVPLCFDVSDDEEAGIAGNESGLFTLGVGIRKAGRLSYEITSLREEFLTLPETDLIEMVKGSRGEGWARKLYARAACRLAMKEGDTVDRVTAVELLSGALTLDPPRCPHGRPIWHEISRKDLYRLVDRPV
jgi:DNA mismatch repair protein MutL